MSPRGSKPVECSLQVTLLASHDGRPMVGVFNADPTLAAASARRLASLDAEIACFGHGEPLRRDAAASLAELEHA
jgi:glyoxylase-like metal-dependent hydrolase (beta-lactamase superfamily II)